MGIGTVLQVRFCCDNPVGFIYHNDNIPYHKATSLDTQYFSERVPCTTGGFNPFALEVEKGILRPIEVKSTYFVRRSRILFK